MEFILIAVAVLAVWYFWDKIVAMFKMGGE